VVSGFSTSSAETGLPVEARVTLTREPEPAIGGIDPCGVLWLGTAPYQETWDLQRRLGELRSHGRLSDTLLLLEHPPTYTLGRTGDPANILLTEEQLAARGASLFRTDRGGDVTFHGPGQLVGYPILLIEDRRDLLRYIRQLEEVLIRSLRELGVESGRVDGLSGVWVDAEKIAAIGVKMGRVTSHGFALNVSTDLRYFEHIIPCGIRDRGVTSIQRLLAPAGAVPPSVAEVARVVARHFGEVFQRRMVEQSASGAFAVEDLASSASNVVSVG